MTLAMPVGVEVGTPAAVKHGVDAVARQMPVGVPEVLSSGIGEPPTALLAAGEATVTGQDPVQVPAVAVLMQVSRSAVVPATCT